MKVINTIKTFDGEYKDTITINGENRYVCCICRRICFRKIKSNKMVYCDKHYKQIKKYGDPVDSNPRTMGDRNEIRIFDDYAEMDIYDKVYNVVCVTKIDLDDVDKVKNIKWKLSNSGYIMNTPKYKGSSIHLSRIILGVNCFVDHINHDPLDNRKANLRVVTKSQNAMNKESIGVHRRKTGKYIAYIKKDGIMYNLGLYVIADEAFFARWYAEQLLFGEYCYPKEKPTIPYNRESEIVEYVNRKVQRL